jgi:hypothetical protein
MANRALALIAVLFIAGCATPIESWEAQRAERDANLARQRQQKLEQLDRELSSWHGADINVLISQWGAPSSTYTLPNGNLTYSYTWSIAELFCTKNFTVDQNTARIISHSWRGFCAI